jgi:hypothetical protein
MSSALRVRDRRSEPVAEHHGADRLRIGRTVTGGLDQRGELEEVVGTDSPPPKEL